MSKIKISGEKGAGTLLFEPFHLDEHDPLKELIYAWSTLHHRYDSPVRAVLTRHVQRLLGIHRYAGYDDASVGVLKSRMDEYRKSHPPEILEAQYASLERLYAHTQKQLGCSGLLDDQGRLRLRRGLRGRQAFWARVLAEVARERKLESLEIYENIISSYAYQGAYSSCGSTVELAVPAEWIVFASTMLSFYPEEEYLVANPHPMGLVRLSLPQKGIVAFEPERDTDPGMEVLVKPYCPSGGCECCRVPLEEAEKAVAACLKGHLDFKELTRQFYAAIQISDKPPSALPEVEERGVFERLGRWLDKKLIG